MIAASHTAETHVALKHGKPKRYVWHAKHPTARTGGEDIASSSASNDRLARMQPSHCQYETCGAVVVSGVYKSICSAIPGSLWTVDSSPIAEAHTDHHEICGAAVVGGILN